LLVACQHELDARRSLEGKYEVGIFFARDAEDVFDAFGFEALDEKIRSFHEAWFLLGLQFGYRTKKQEPCQLGRSRNIADISVVYEGHSLTARTRDLEICEISLRDFTIRVRLLRVLRPVERCQAISFSMSTSTD